MLAGLFIVTDMYLPNPKCLRDWLSVPKSNDESLHIRSLKVKWVESQIRTERMDEIAEKGSAAWRYKGIKGEADWDEWLNTIRETLENADSDLEVMDQFKLDLISMRFLSLLQGDLNKLPQGGSISFRSVNGKNVQLKQRLSENQVENHDFEYTDSRKRDWLNFVTTSKARNKSRLLRKLRPPDGKSLPRETLERKFKNRKLEYDEAILMRSDT